MMTEKGRLRRKEKSNLKKSKFYQINMFLKAHDTCDFNLNKNIAQKYFVA